jgi:hypothetical protein
VQEFIGDRLAEQKAALESGAAKLKGECEDMMTDLRGNRCVLPSGLRLHRSRCVRCAVYCTDMSGAQCTARTSSCGALSTLCWRTPCVLGSNPQHMV